MTEVLHVKYMVALSTHQMAYAVCALMGVKTVSMNVMIAAVNALRLVLKFVFIRIIDFGLFLYLCWLD